MSDSPEPIEVFLPASGRIYLDFIFTGVPRIPAAGEEIFAQRFDAMAGGAYNAARALHRLGVGAHLAADLGPDMPSQIVRGLWDRDGLPATFRRDIDRPTAAVTCSYSLNHDRAFLSYADSIESPLADADLLRRYGMRHVLLTGIPRTDDFLPMLDAARETGASVYMDSQFVELDLSDGVFVRHLARVDVYFCNEVEARLFTGCAHEDDAARAFLRYAACVVIKHGGRGATLYRPEKKIVQPAPVIEAVDTTGAGDCFVAGFVSGRVLGLDDAGCLRRAVGVGSMTCLGIGGAAAPDAEALASFLPSVPRAVVSDFSVGAKT